MSQISSTLIPFTFYNIFHCCLSDLDLQMGLKEADFHRAASISWLPFHLRYLAIPQVRYFALNHFFGWMDKEVNLYTNMFGREHLQPPWVDKKIDVSIPIIIAMFR